MLANPWSKPPGVDVLSMRPTWERQRKPWRLRARCRCTGRAVPSISSSPRGQTRPPSRTKRPRSSWPWRERPPWRPRYVWRSCNGRRRLFERLADDDELSVRVGGCRKICSRHVVGVGHGSELAPLRRVDTTTHRTACERTDGEGQCPRFGPRGSAGRRSAPRHHRGRCRRVDHRRRWRDRRRTTTPSAEAHDLADDTSPPRSFGGDGSGRAIDVSTPSGGRGRRIVERPAWVLDTARRGLTR